MRPMLVIPLMALVAITAVTPAAADHNGNVRVVSIARQLAQEADYCARQAEYAVGWGDWTDRQAVSELRRFASYTQSLYGQASAIEPGGPSPFGASVAGARVGVLDHNDEDIGRRLASIFRATWSQADQVEYYLYSASWRLQSAVRSYWDYRVCSSLRQLRSALGGVSPWGARDADRVARFGALTARP